MKDLPPDRWRFPREPRSYRRYDLWAEAIYWTGLVAGCGKAVLAAFHFAFSLLELLRYGAPPGTDSLQSLDLGQRAADLFVSAGLVVAAVFVSATLALLTEISRNVRRQRMVAEIAQGLKAVDPPGVP